MNIGALQVTVTYTYPDGFHITYNSLPVHCIPPRHRSVVNKFRPVRIHVQCDESVDDLIRDFIFPEYEMLTHVYLREGIWLNGKKLTR